MLSEMKPFIGSRSNDKRPCITDVGNFALAVAFPFRLVLPFGAIAAS
jgi:hypothetical protein